MRKLQTICLAILLLLNSCGDNVQTEKDEHPEIPDFPEFKDRVFQSKNISTIKITLGKTVRYKEKDYYFKYVIKDDALYIMTFFADTEFPEIVLNDNYTVDLIIITNKDLVKKHIRWSDVDFDINLSVDEDHNVTAGKRKYLIKTNYEKFDEVEGLHRDPSETPVDFKSWQSRPQEQVENLDYFHRFSSAITASDGNITGGANHPWGYQYSPVYLIYYELTYKNKIGLTKINYERMNAPLFIKLHDEIYYITYEEDYVGIENGFKKYLINKIED